MQVYTHTLQKEKTQLLAMPEQSLAALMQTSYQAAVAPVVVDLEKGIIQSQKRLRRLTGLKMRKEHDR